MDDNLKNNLFLVAIDHLFKEKLVNSQKDSLGKRMDQKKEEEEEEEIRLKRALSPARG